MPTPSTTGFGLTTMYHRHGGMMQMHPLSPEEQKYDDTCREIDALEGKIAAKSMALFTAGEFMWFSAFVNKMHVFPNQERLDLQLANLRDLLAKLDSR